MSLESELDDLQIVVTDTCNNIDNLRAEILRLRGALTEISKGEGAFSRDSLTHANNCIESMKQIALDALGK